MASVTPTLRADDREVATWRRIAESVGDSFNAWARRSLNEQAALDEALLREAEDGRRAD